MKMISLGVISSLNRPVYLRFGTDTRTSAPVSHNEKNMYNTIYLLPTTLYMLIIAILYCYMCIYMYTNQQYVTCIYHNALPSSPFWTLYNPWSVDNRTFRVSFHKYIHKHTERSLSTVPGIVYLIVSVIDSNQLAGSVYEPTATAKQKPSPHIEIR